MEPREFPARGPELTPPPDEFNTGAPPSLQKKEKKTRRRRIVSLTAAALASVWLLISAPPAPAPTATSGLTPTPTVEPTPTQTPSPSPTPSPNPSPASTPSPTPSPTPEPTPEPTPAPEYDAPKLFPLCVSFSDRIESQIKIIHPESVTVLRVEMWEPNLNERLGVYEFSAEEIALAEGVLKLPSFDTGESYFAHMEEYERLNAEPDIELRGEMIYDSPEGERRESFTQRSEYEIGWTLRYWQEDADSYEWTRPGWFEFTTYETPVVVRFVFDDPEGISYSRKNKEVETAISVSFSIDGREIAEDECEYVLEEIGEYEDTDGDLIRFYNAKLYFPRMDWMPKKGTVHVTVEQYLLNYQQTMLLEMDYDYEIHTQVQAQNNYWQYEYYYVPDYGGGAEAHYEEPVPDVVLPPEEFPPDDGEFFEGYWG